VSLLVGLTGGIGSGKSLAASFFKEEGAHIIDADQLSRDLVRPGKPALKEIVNIFGDFILEFDGTLNREKLANIIFQDLKKKAALEAILHPKIIEKEHEEYSFLRAKDPSSIVIIDAALLIESGNFKSVDKVIVVQSSEEQQVKRILSRSSLTYNQALARIKNQMSLADKNIYADFTLDNQFEPEDLRENVITLYKKLLKSHKK
jgi:dephospho-CoA kinase